jgi:hypothetical protein
MLDGKDLKYSKKIMANLWSEFAALHSEDETTGRANFLLLTNYTSYVYFETLTAKNLPCGTSPQVNP